MKKIILGFILLLLATTTFSQQNNPTSTMTEQDYLKKSKHQKTFAWVLLGGGILSTSLGLAGSGINPDYGEKGGNGFLVTGLVAIGASIPLFIASSKNKRKAASISINNKPSLQVQKSSFVYKSIPSITFKLQL